MMTRQNPFKKRSVNIYLAQLKFALLVAAVMIVILLLTSCMPYASFITVTPRNDVPEGTKEIIVQCPIDTFMSVLKK
jgi:hypothetical protein